MTAGVVAVAAPVADRVERAEAELEEAAGRALQLASRDPAAATALSRSLLDRARRDGHWPVVSTLERALGVAAVNRSEIDEAVVHLRAAVAAGRRAASPTRIGEARMGLASALALQGHPGQAIRQIDAAVRHLDGVEAARAGVQRAAILQDLGRDDAALEELRRALPVLRRAEDAEWAVRALSNRSLIHARRRSFGVAEADQRDAHQLCLQYGLELPAAYADQALGRVKAQRGDVPAALRHFAAAEERYRRFGLLEASILVDKAQVLLSVRLLDEARSTAEAAIEAYRNQKRDFHLPEAQLLLSTVALVQGDCETAAASAVGAVEGFRRVGRDTSLPLARYAHFQALAGGDPRRLTPARAARAAEDLAALGWQIPSLEARILAGRMALDRGQHTAARRHLSLAARTRRSGPAAVRARAWLAEALLRRADGRRAAAQSALRAGLRIVENHQATFGATDLRAHASVHRVSLTGSGLRMSLEDRRPREVLWWAERGRASALLLRPAHPPDDEELARDLADLRSTMAEIDEARQAGRPTDAGIRRQVLLERRIRDRGRTLEAGVEPRRMSHTQADLVAALDDHGLIEFVHSEGHVHAVTVSGGRFRLHALGPLDALRQPLAHVPFALRRLAQPRAGEAGRVAAGEVLRRAAAGLDDLLLRPLRNEIRDRPLVVVPPGQLQSVPWSILPSCRGRPVTVSPSATLWLRAVCQPAPEPRSDVVVVAGPGLPGATAEAETIAGLHPGSRLLSGADATVAAVAACMDGAALVHLAAHGNLRPDNPLFSSLTLADGPFTVYELERLRRPPHHLVLAACDTGRSQVVAGEELLGFGAALLGGATTTLIAPIVPIDDAQTVALMEAFHRGLRSGRRPAPALAAAQQGLDAADPAAAAAAAFVCLGAG